MCIQRKEAGYSISYIYIKVPEDRYMVGMSNIHAARKYGKRWRKTTALNGPSECGDDGLSQSTAAGRYQPGECAGDGGPPAAAVPRHQPEPSRARVLALDSEP